MSLARVVAGFRLPLEALALLRRDRSIRAAAVMPLVISATALAAGIALVVVWMGELYGLATGWLPWPEAATWFSWLWVGPARLLLGVVGVVAFAALAGAVVVAAFLVGGVAAAPFLDRLSRRVEETLTGSVIDVSPPGLAGFVGGAARAALEEGKRLGVFLVAQAALGIVGIVVPGAQLPAGAAMIVLTAVFLALDSSGYALDRRGLGFAEKLRWSRTHSAAVAGFAGSAFLVCSIPVVNLVALPVLVAAGTLLVVESERDRRLG